MTNTTQQNPTRMSLREPSEGHPVVMPGWLAALIFLLLALVLLGVRAMG